MYRNFSDLLDGRIKAAEDLHKISTGQDKFLAALETLWVKIVRREDLDRSISKCEKMLKLCPNDLSKCLTHFWLAMGLWTKCKVELQNEDKESQKEISEKILEIGDLNCAYYKVLSLEIHESIMENLQKCLEILDKNSFQDEMFQKEDFVHLKESISNIFQLCGIEKSEGYLEISENLLKNGHFSQVEKILNYLENNRPKIGIPKYFQDTEILCLKGQIGLYTNEENPMKFARLANYKSAFCTNHFNQNNCIDLESLSQMFKSFILLKKVRELNLQLLTSVGLVKEMRMISNLCVKIGVDSGFLPNLILQLLAAVEIDLFCDDSKQAQVKLKEIEALYKEKLRKSPQKVKTNAKNGKNSRLVLPKENEELHCASPSLKKIVYNLPEEFCDFELEIILKYFTFQAVTWKLEEDSETMEIYFNKVIEVIQKYVKNQEIFPYFFTLLRWMLESYIHLSEFSSADGILKTMKNTLVQEKSPFWLSYFKEASISLNLAKRTRQENVEPSPIRLGSTLYEMAKNSKTPVPEKAEKKSEKPPRIRPKRVLPVNCDMAVQKMAELNVNEEEEDFRMVKTTRSSRRKKD